MKQLGHKKLVKSKATKSEALFQLFETSVTFSEVDIVMFH